MNVGIIKTPQKKVLLKALCSMPKTKKLAKTASDEASTYRCPDTSDFFEGTDDD